MSDLQDLEIRGPGWTATVDAVTLDNPKALAVRSLFAPRARDGRPAAGTVQMLCIPREIRAKVGDRPTWSLSDDGSAEIEERLREGRASLLVLEPLDGRVRDKSKLRCLAGQIHSRSIASAKGHKATMQLLEELDLRDPADDARKDDPEHQLLIGPWVEASGIGLRASVPLPWEREPITLPLHLTPIFDSDDRDDKATPDDPLDFRLSVRRELLTKDERRSLESAWKDLGVLLRHAGTGAARGPAWAHLEPVGEIPELSWTVKREGGEHIRRGLDIPAESMRLLLSDAPLGDQVNPPRSLVRLRLGKIGIEAPPAPAEEESTQITLRVSAGEAEPKATDASPSLIYGFDAAGTGSGGGTDSEVPRESVTLVQDRDDPLPLGFEPDIWPSELRSDLGLPEPRWFPTGSEQRKSLQPPLLWPAVKLDRGWLQLPLPNLSAQVFARAGLYQRPARKAAQRAGFFEGALALGNRRLLERGFDPASPENPWTLNLLNAASLTGEWILDPDGTPATRRVRLKLGDPELLLSGLLWTGTERPSERNLLPSLEDWIGGLRQIPLRRLRPGLPLQLPILLARITDPEDILLWQRDLDAAAAGDTTAIRERMKKVVEGFVQRTGQDGDLFPDEIDSVESAEASEDRVSHSLKVAGRVLYAMAVDEAGALELRMEPVYQLVDALKKAPIPDEPNLPAKDLPVPDRLDLLAEDLPAVPLARLLEQCALPRDLFQSTSRKLTAEDDPADFLGSWEIQTDSGARCTLESDNQTLRIYRTGADPMPALVLLRLKPHASASGASAPGRSLLAITASEDSEGDTGNLLPSPRPLLGDWTLEYQIDSRLLARLTRMGVLKAPGSSAGGNSADVDWPSPIAWLRHPTLPLIQSLPITQTRIPANHPAESRQLFPFEPTGSDPLEIKAGKHALDWPAIAGPLLPGAAQNQIGTGDSRWPSDLTMASLSLPGLEFHPPSQGTAGGEDGKSDPFDAMIATYRWDLPYTDEVHALAELPEPSPAGGSRETTPDTGEPGSRIDPLDPTSWGVHWQRLANKAALAALDAVEAWPGDNGGTRKVRNLIQPYEWDANPRLEQESYPGSIDLGGETLSGCRALEGVTGRFKVDKLALIPETDDPSETETDGTPSIFAGSLSWPASRKDSDSALQIQDQRGLIRSFGAPHEKISDFWVSRVTSPADGDEKREEQSWDLATTFRALELTLTEGAGSPSWALWFRDLPFDENRAFDRVALWGDALKAMAGENQGSEDYRSQVNFPESRSREFNHRMGYEWRLAGDTAEAGGQSSLRLGPLDFFPLTLERVSIEETEDEGRISEVIIHGRLQLRPFSGATDAKPTPVRELADFSNVVVLTFTAPGLGGSLRLTALSLLPDNGDGVWPLGVDGEGNLQEGAPILMFDGLELDAGNILLREPKVRLQLHGTDWDMRVKEDISFSLETMGASADGGMPNKSLEPPVPSDEISLASFRYTGGSLVLRPESGEHELDLDLILSVSRQPEPAESDAGSSDVKLEGKDFDYRVRRGDTLWGIAKRFLGDGMKYHAIWLHNESIRHPDQIFAGQSINVPRAILYTVESPISLSALARRYFGRRRKRKLIYDTNLKLGNEHLAPEHLDEDKPLGKGWKLLLPIDETLPLPRPHLPTGQELPAARKVLSMELKQTWPGKDRTEKSQKCDLFGGLGLKNLKGKLFGRLGLEDLELNLQDDALQLQWGGVTRGNDTQPLPELLPGMPLNPTPEGGASPLVPAVPAAGCATVLFRVRQTKDGKRLETRAVFIQSLLHCRWGRLTFDAGSTGSASFADLATPSAGDLLVDYRSRATFAPISNNENAAPLPTWDETLLLSGVLEIANLISWLPEKQTAANSIPAHTRHRLRVLLNQHRLPTQTLLVGQAPAIFDLADAWRFLAVTEHEATDLKEVMDPENEPETGSRRRWSLIQELRLMRPRVFAKMLNENDTRKVVDPFTGERKFVSTRPSVRGLRDEVVAAIDDQESGKRTPLIIVEAGAVIWIRQNPVDDRGENPVNDRIGFLDLQFLPNGVQRAIPTEPESLYAADPGKGSSGPWMLLPLPFLGRLVSSPAGCDKATATAADTLRCDPLLLLRSSNATGDLLKLSRRLSHRGTEVKPSELDTGELGRLAWLDSATLDEAWMRLHNAEEGGTEPDAAALEHPDGLPGISATDAEGLGTLARPENLARLFDPFRPAYPPRPDKDVGVMDGDPRAVWDPRSLLIVDQAADTEATGWQGVGKRLKALSEKVPNGQVHYMPAVTLLPAHEPSPDDRPNPMPMTFAVAPYFALEFRAAPDHADATGESQAPPALLSSTELVCVRWEPITRDEESVPTLEPRLAPVASRFWEPAALRRRLDHSRKEAKKVEMEVNRETLEPIVLDWARATHRRLAPDSPIALLRWREVTGGGEQGDEPGDPGVRYLYNMVPCIERIRDAPTPALALRLPPSNIREREAQFGGFLLPRNTSGFELTAPSAQVAPVQLRQSPQTSVTDPEADCPGESWKRNALRFEIAFHPTSGSVAATKTVGQPVRRWWQALQQNVQFRVAGDLTAGLPPLFRAGPVPALAPVSGGICLPEVESDSGSSTPATEDLLPNQPLLPDRVRVLIQGARAGAFFAFRPQLITDDGGTGLLSGSVPMQYRAPRPAALPHSPVLKKNGSDHAAHAAVANQSVQTWGSYWDSGSSCRVTTSPADEVFYGGGSSEQALPLGQRLTLTYPARGEIGPDWDGRLEGRIEVLGENSKQWSLVPTLRLTEDYVLAKGGIDPTAEDFKLKLNLVEKNLALNAKGKPGPALRDLVARLAEGGEYALEILTELRLEGKDKALVQRMRFPLRVGSGKRLPLPLRPHFVQFEDPEYNRALATPARIASEDVQVELDGGERVLTLTLAADRREYNSDGILYLMWGRSSLDSPVEVSLVGLALEVKAKNEDDHREWPTDEHTPEKLAEALNELVGDKPPEKSLMLVPLKELGKRLRPLQPGDRIRLQASFEISAKKDTTQSVNLDLEVVSAPVNPVPEAGYALLRRKGTKEPAVVECVRFAWGPPSSRIELVAGTDLLSGVVRRRAVFQWLDNSRPGQAGGYAVQKITGEGSTNIPTLEEMVQAQVAEATE